jgi:glycosyltransferase involved in cell wall biosynthesis
MTNQTPKIVVITPVKNEDWILDRFLAVTSQFADHIIIANQNSTDQSVAICKRYPKVTVIENKSEKFNEAERQILLIQTARNLVPEHKILLALDADEILAASATKTLGWQSMLKAKPGTVLCFEKPDLYLRPNQCIRYDIPWPLGYVDDGVEHQATQIHSIRIPMPDYAPRLYIHDVKILHYSGVRPAAAQAAKYRMYSVLENVLSTGFPLTRRGKYDLQMIFTNLKWRASPSLSEWFVAWEEIGIDMHTIIDQKYAWQDFEVLRYFHKYGLRRFWIDDIWEFDWEACRLYAKSLGMNNIPDYEIKPPPRSMRAIIRNLTDVYMGTRKFIKADKNLWD